MPLTITRTTVTTVTVRLLQQFWKTAGEHGKQPWKWRMSIVIINVLINPLRVKKFDYT